MSDDMPVPSAWIVTGEGQTVTPPRRLLAYGRGASPLTIRLEGQELVLRPLSGDVMEYSSGSCPSGSCRTRSSFRRGVQ